ncbi:hypothetical protein [Pseudoalteromonas piscicida]|uniref:hypothetical protein n=1 Tax=Pseudoalteromonas piscicida TaxID=43662 RepID=UPI001F5BD7C7|nr:hypothetical protein [Pseudoalteromonas piscicida]
MKKNFSLGDLLIPYAIVAVGLLVLYDIRFHFYLIYLLIVSTVFILGARLKDINICTLSILAVVPFTLETIVFSSGLISLESSKDQRLLQNTLIFGTHFIIGLLIIFPLTYRVEITKKLFPKLKSRYTFADAIMPWLAIFNVVMSFAALVENYFRNAKGANMTFFFYSFDVSGYLIYSANCLILLSLAAITYKEEYDYALPSIRKKR